MKVRIRLKRKLLKSLGRRIRELRCKQGLTQEELAFAAGIDPSYVGGIEIGRRSPSIYCLFSIASVLKVSLSELVDFEMKSFYE